MMKQSDWVILFVGTLTVFCVMAFVFQYLSH